MRIEGSKNVNQDTFSTSIKIDKKNIVCKDGFCSLPNQEQNTSIKRNGLDFFDPI